ncbi:hypothetical protein N7510_008834 [Penicillium lagena]|uniref:uncharacterized protein n=1 Tax=Penicillium lagena TaxID=94218 RepID=UPI002541B3F7|nr:uncharacterized protein N7510_008834 [Penicillium lagena]KAJ5606053.1 hypothetical protein N7510_008834 [Penicillium lagena]
MHVVPPHPIRRPPARFARKYGSTFNYLDRAANVSLCDQALGKVRIDCGLRLSKSQWGVAGPVDNQAGILYMDLTFGQTKDSRLTSAVVEISLEDLEDLRTGSDYQIEPESTPRDNLPVQTNEENRVMVNEVVERIILRLLHFTHFGPRELCGEPTKTTTKTTRHLTPNVNVLGNGAGGLGLDQEQTVEQTSRWLFTGNLHRGSKLGAGQRSILSRTLRWELSEDDFQPQPMHSNVIQTGFALEHDCRPFYIRVEIQGKLQRKHGRFKNNMKQLLRFPSESKKRQGTTMTLVLPDRRMANTRRLDAIAQGLPYDMERANLESVRVQLPSALPASFQEAAPISQGQTASQCGLPASSKAERPSAATAPLELPQSQGEIWRGGELNEEGFREPLAEQAGSLRPVRISSKRDSTEETLSQGELNELVSQLAQFPVLLRIFLWLVSMIKFAPKKTPKKSLKGD